MNKTRKPMLIIVFIAVATIDLLLLTLLIFKKEINLEDIPDTWSPDYVESEKDYNANFANIPDWSKPPIKDEPYTAITIPIEQFSTYEQFSSVSVKNMTLTDAQIIQLSDSEAWRLCSNNVFENYPTCSYRDIKNELAIVKKSNTETITVKCWFWEDPNDDTNMNKITKTKTFAVNSAIASLFKHIFDDIYADESKPVLNLQDTGMGTWVLRGKNHSDKNTLSSHSLGTAIDINPSTGSWYVNGVWYGNAYKQRSMPKAIWEQLPECHKKYHVLYEGCPIVSIFKSYGFYWGGDWLYTPDPMHLAFLGDGPRAREVGIDNYNRSNR